MSLLTAAETPTPVDQIQKRGEPHVLAMRRNRVQ